MPKEKPATTKKSLPADATKMAIDATSQLLKQVEDQFAQISRNPQLMGLWSAAMDQSLALTGRIQEIVTATLRTMNMPTRDDVKELNRRLDDLSGQLDEINEKLDALKPASSSESAAPKKKPAPTRRRTVRVE